MIRIIYILNLFVCISYCSAIKGQSQLASELAKDFYSFLKDNPTERCYVHTDKTNYLPGETVWFKAYITQTSLITDSISKYVYVTLANSKDEIIDKKKFLIKNKSCNGEFDLSKTLTDGSYKISCYTQWMLNEPEFIFNKLIYIGKKIKSSNAEKLFDNIQFFAEGGNLIAGEENNLSFKTTDKNGNGIATSFKIVDSKNNIIAQSTTNTRGLGSINFKPSANEKYYVKLNNKDFYLPQVLDEGISLRVHLNNENKIFISLLRGSKNEQLYNEFLLLGIQNNSIVFNSNFDFNEDITATAINRKDLKPGILQLTVFDKQKKPIAERLVFISPEQNELIDKNFQFNKLKKAINSFSINTNDHKANVSISVVDAKTQPQFYNDNIITGLLLTGDLRGKIEGLNEILNLPKKERDAAFDLIMLTNGWRKFEWKKIIDKKLDKIKYLPESDLNITGLITHKKDKYPLIGKTINFVFKAEDSTNIIGKATTGKDGGFIFKIDDFRKSGQLAYSFANEDDAKKSSILFLPHYIDSVKFEKTNPKIFYQPEGFFENTNAEIVLPNKLQEGKILAEVKVKTKKISKADSIANEYAGGFFKDAGKNIIPDEKFAYADIYDMIQNLVPGANIYRDPQNFGSVEVSLQRGRYFEMGYNSGMTNQQFYLNEIPIDATELNTINPKDVALMKLITDGSGGGSLGFNVGALAIYTKKDIGNNPWGNKNNYPKITVKGLSYNRVFAHPNWLSIADDNTKKNELEKIKDNRITLLWNPNVILDIDGKAELKFANSDNVEKVKICIQGIKSNGELIYDEKIF